MALQHFYSRVPARVSMHNKIDGFDTFAQSASLEREFVERELAYVYENKLSKKDIPAVLRGQMPCIYTQSCTHSGRLVQNKVTYISSDYTGERSAYLSHSLVFSKEEKKRIFSSAMDNALNPSLFSVTINDFDIVSSAAAPNAEYPCIEYLPGKTRENGYLLAELDQETVCTFLYAVLNSVCGKGKNVCFKMSGDDSLQSEQSVQIFNEVLSILPFQLRSGLSFASYVTEPSQYSNYKLRAVSADFPENAPKCVCIDLLTTLVVGVRIDDVVANKNLVEFFYSLLKCEKLRTEFLSFTAKAAETIPALQNLNFKLLGNLVFLFKCGSGMFSEQEVLPDDTSIYDFLCAYEKYRDALSDEYRVRGYRALLRYRENHLAIPKNIFAKVSRLYGTELPEAKRIVMAISLELIHTDVMRDKLFAFIKTYYHTEEAEQRQVIISNLTRVFYGGFLQAQLLSFFFEFFAEESEESKTLIFEKLLLSIRTPAVQGKILVFIEQHYDNLTENLKSRFYDTFFEMLTECDGLSQSLVSLVNRLVLKETDETVKTLSARITEALEADYRRKEHNLLPVLSGENGFCHDLVIALAYGEWQSRKIRSDYAELMLGKNAKQITELAFCVFELVPAADRRRLLSEVVPVYEGDTALDLYGWLALGEKIAALPADFALELHKIAIAPAVSRRAEDVFDITVRPDGMELLEAYASAHPSVRDEDGYSIITAYHGMTEAALSGDYTAANTFFTRVSAKAELSRDIAAHFTTVVPKGESLCADIIRSLLKYGNAGLARHYARRADDMGGDTAMEHLLTVCTAMCEGGAEFAQALTAPDSGLKEAVHAFVELHGRGATRWLESRLTTPCAFGESVLQAAQSTAKQGFFARLFKK